MINIPETKDLLLEAFDIFTKASGALETTYSQLQKRAAALSLELETANQKLIQNLEEKERVRNYLNTILESLPCGVLVVSLQGEVTICNPLATRLLALAPPRREPFSTSYRELLGPHPLAAHIAACLANTARPSLDVELQTYPQGPVLTVSSSPMGSPSGALVGVTFIIKDITKIKKLEAQTRRAERLSAMGEMALELAHEIRNPLASIELLASLLCQNLAADTDPAAWAGHIRVGVRSLNTILSNMLHFSRELEPAIQPLDIHALIEDTLSFAGPLIEARGVTLVKSFMAANPLIPGDRELLKQVFLNLVFNALQAMPESGLLEVATRYRHDPAAAHGPHLEIKFKDTGMGIDPLQADRLFDPHYTTTKNGNGLGLAVVHRIVESHRGRILVESVVNEGATFTILLPPAEPAPAQPLPEAPAPRRCRGHGQGVATS